MITRFPTRATVAACVCFVLASLGLTLFVWRSVGGSIPFGAKRYEVRALFSDAGQLAPNADVRISGVNVGKVTGVRQRGLRTEATLSIEPRYAPLPADVRAILRQKTLLGETFVALSTGSRDGPRLADGGTIPVDRIEPTQPLDRVMSTLDAKGREQLHELLVDTGTLLDGRAQDLGDTLGNLGPGMRRLEAVTEVLDSQRDDVTRLVSSVGDVLQTVGDERAAVRELVGAGNRALAATASRDDELTATVRAAPALLRELRRTTAAVERTAQVAAPVLRDFRPVAPRVAPALEAMQRATPDIEGLLSDLQAMLPTARRARAGSSTRSARSWTSSSPPPSMSRRCCRTSTPTGASSSRRWRTCRRRRRGPRPACRAGRAATCGRSSRSGPSRSSARRRGSARTGTTPTWRRAAWTI